MRIPIEAYIQNDLKAGSDEVAPIPKAIKFVTDVIVMAAPAWDIIAPILSTKGLDRSCSVKIQQVHISYLLMQAKKFRISNVLYL